MKTHIYILLLLSFFDIDAIAQYSLGGKVFDKETKEPVIGACIVAPGTQTGTITNTNGVFELKSEKQIDSIEITIIGYEKLKLITGSMQNLMITLCPSSTNMQEVIITASREEQDRSEVPIAINTISSKVINDAKPTSIEQVLNKASGVYMANLGNEQHNMSIRQPLSYNSLFLYLEDGIPIRTAGLFNHNALIEINMAGVRNIEIIKGPASSLYGQEAIGGAVNFITLGPTAIPTTKVSLQGNDLGYRRTDFQAASTFNKFGFSLTGYYAQRKNGILEFSDFHKAGLTFRGDYRINEKTILNNSISWVDYYSDMPGGLDSLKFSKEDYSNYQTFTYRDVYSLRAKSALTHRWNNQSKTCITAVLRDNSIKQNPSYFIKDDYKPWNGQGNKKLAHGQENDVFFKSYVLVAQHKQSFKWKEAAIIIGATGDYSLSGYMADYICIHKSDDGYYTNYDKTDSSLTDYAAKVSNYAAYTHFEFSPIDKLRFVGALRFDNFIYNYTNHLPSTAYSGAPSSSNYFNAVSPKAGLTYDFGNKSGLYCNYSQGFVPPQITALYSGVKVPSLKPSSFYNYELGGWAALINEKVYLDLSIYQLNGTDEIISVRLDDGTFANRNAGQTKHTGIEYGLFILPYKELSIRVSGTNADHKYETFIEKGADYSNKQMANAPKFIANAEAIYKPLFFKGIRIGIEWQHLDNYYMDQNNTVKYPGFNLFNIRTGYEWKNTEIWVNVLNIGNIHYATMASKSQWGYSYNLGEPRNVNVGFAYKFSGKK